MTLRAVILGLLCGAAIAWVCYFNDFVMQQTFLIGNYMPISVYGGLLLFLLVFNPLLFRLSRWLSLSGRELAVVVALTLAACYVPGRGLMHYFSTLIMMPHHYARTIPGWKEEGIVELAPKQMLADISRNESQALGGFIQGLGEGSRHIAWGQIPWYAWWRTLAFWVPLLLTFSLAMIGVALVVHRQWSAHEQLPYPIITFASALLPGEGDTQGGVFRSRLFWLGILPVLLIHMNNYGYEWWPRYLIQVPRTYDFRSLTPLIPSIQRFGDWALMNPTFYFTAIGFAYFLAADVSLSLGLAPYVYAVVVGTLMGYGVSVAGGGFIALNIQTFLFGGAYFGMFLVLLYTGRHYYLNVFRQSVFLRPAERVEPLAAWGARVFLVGAALFAAQLFFVGLSWYLALLYTAGAVVIYVVISRVVAETGVFFIHAYHFPCVLMWGFFGAKVLGPQAMLIMFLVTSLLLIDPREAVMPFMVQGFKLVDTHRVKLGRVAWFAALALAISFAIAVPRTLYWQYDRGASTVSDGWTRYVPQMSFDATVRAQQTLRAQGNLDEAGHLSGLDWFRNLSPNWDCVKAFGISLALVLIFSAGRMRFSRWPIHPILFLVLGTYQSRTLGASFLLGWLVKVLVTKYGGASAYQKIKPLMIGLIAGDMLGGLLPMIVGAIYWHFTGEPPKRFMVLTY